MSIFNLHSSVLPDYRDLLRSFISVADDRARKFIEWEMVAEARFYAHSVKKQILCAHAAVIQPAHFPKT